MRGLTDRLSFGKATMENNNISEDQMHPSIDDLLDSQELNFDRAVELLMPLTEGRKAPQQLSGQNWEVKISPDTIWVLTT